jgi:hypothetical protein
MMTSIDHPLLFCTLVCADVLENMFCLYSLRRTLRAGSTRKISPSEISSGNDEREEDDFREEKSSLRRTSSVYNLIQDLDKKSTSQKKGIAMFIAATLLQREMVETIVPIQAMGVFSILYAMDVKSNSIIASMNSADDYHRTMMYMGIDLLVEVIVFTSSTIALKWIFPDIQPWNILRGLVKMHFVSMFIMMFGAWIAELTLSCTFLGMDPTYKFKWLDCDDKENSTWLGGFRWEC